MLLVFNHISILGRVNREPKWRSEYVLMIRTLTLFLKRGGGLSIRNYTGGNSSQSVPSFYICVPFLNFLHHSLVQKHKHCQYIWIMVYPKVQWRLGILDKCPFSLLSKSFSISSCLPTPWTTVSPCVQQFISWKNPLDQCYLKCLRSRGNLQT